MRFLVAMLFIANLSCSTSPADAGATGGVITLRFGQTAVVAGTSISFTDILDSRCPKEVVCAWAGDAAVRLESGHEYVLLHTNLTAGPAAAKLANRTTTLIEVKPERVALSEPKKTDYVITVRVTE